MNLESIITRSDMIREKNRLVLKYSLRKIYLAIQVSIQIDVGLSVCLKLIYLKSTGPFSIKVISIHSLRH